jgi:mediator of RNA polymerase II transcription subunit 12
MDTDMDDLSSLLNQVLGHRAASSAPIPAPTFRMPARVTFTEAKRHAWFADLAREDVPLHKLGRNVPHGTRGAELLALLHTHAVPPDRATWLVRIIGANESVRRSTRTPVDDSRSTGGTVEW